ncbi:MAG: CPBP family intramembrane metalloprotease [Bacillota bacterium]|nr:CPBP family intramembrane metalloprotease [Bacillota bacterium]
MKREYWLVLIVYIVMQLSSLIGVPLVLFILKENGKTLSIAKQLAIPYWLIISFSLALFIILFILRKEMRSTRSERKGSSLSKSILWAFFGVFIALFAQTLAANVEHLFGIQMGSENTQHILQIINAYPLAILVSSIIGPILEEIVFRKILFGSLYKRFNFFISAVISSFIFALAHMEPKHVLIYAAMGFTFAFLYVKTKHILVPIFAHVAMNTLVVVVQSAFRDDIERVLRHAETIQHFIGGFI